MLMAEDCKKEQLTYDSTIPTYCIWHDKKITEARDYIILSNASAHPLDKGN